MWQYIRRILHWGPLLALSVIAVISTSTVLCDAQWWPWTTWDGCLNIAIFATWNTLTLYNFFCAAFVGPGLVPFGWKPKRKDDNKYLQRCTFCDGYKAPRSHHCRKCQRCVMKMDHHCPWINNCVGFQNHAHFTAFLFWAPCGCIHALCILIPSMYRAINRSDYLEEGRKDVPIVQMSVNTFLFGLFGVSFSLGVSVAVGILWYIQTYYIYYGTGHEPLVNIGVRGFIACMFAVGLAVGVIVAVGGLFYIQIRSILRNETGIETWIKEKAAYREKDEDEEDFIYPYDLGRLENFKMVFHWKSRPELNGIWWPVREGCNQFTFTKEQIKQKREKKERSIRYEIRHKYSGTLVPCSFGCKVCCCPPCTDEPRIKVSPGDSVIVSRWKKHWLYGDKVLDAETSKEVKRVRGWFPRKCAIEPFREDKNKEAEHEPAESGDGEPVENGSKKTN